MIEIRVNDENIGMVLCKIERDIEFVLVDCKSVYIKLFEILNEVVVENEIEWIRRI